MSRTFITFAIISALISVVIYNSAFIFDLLDSSDSIPMIKVGCRFLATALYPGVIRAASTHTMNDPKAAESVYDFTVKNQKGEDVSMKKYEGLVLLIVNVASECGLTATNYKELVELHNKYHDKGFRILAFPCNQFGGQEPGSNDDIICFAKTKNAQFDFFDKIDVNGKNADPLWVYLQHKQKGTLVNKIKWNFSKFLVNKKGIPVERYSPTTEPSKLTSSIEKYLNESA